MTTGDLRGANDGSREIGLTQNVLTVSPLSVAGVSHGADLFSLKAMCSLYFGLISIFFDHLTFYHKCMCFYYFWLIHDANETH